MTTRSTLLAGVILVLLAVAILAWASGELVVAGVAFLCVSFAIYLRERYV